jgi:uncharacterized glyoxalase superfamily protein PhnB
VRNAESAIEFYKKAFGAEEPTIIKKNQGEVFKQIVQYRLKSLADIIAC